MRPIDMWEIRNIDDGPLAVNQINTPEGLILRGESVHVVRESEYNALWLEIQQNAKETCHCYWVPGPTPCSVCRARAMIVAADDD